MYISETINVDGKELTFETGKIAKQADGSVTVRMGDTMVLVTVVASKKAKKDCDFIPLTVDYIEKAYAAGKIPGNFFRREGRLGEAEILISRLIDRPLRPLFPDGWAFETQVIATVISHDQKIPSGPLAQIGASLALTLSDIPWKGPVAGVQIGRVDGKLIAYPTLDELKKSDMDLNMVASKDAIVMVEGELSNLDEDTLIEAIYFGFDSVQPILALQIKLQETVGKTKREVPVVLVDKEVEAKVKEVAKEKLIEALKNTEKLPRYAALDSVKAYTIETMGEDYEDKRGLIKGALSKMKYNIVRDWIVNKNQRLDNRGLEDVRDITTEVGLLPSAHSSALFTRGETQAIVTTTLGYGMDNQKLDLITGEEFRSFMLHYNFPPYSVGEARFLRGSSRREIGHGHLAHRALSYVLPDPEDFPYVIRIVSEVTESNGSSSMATVCGGSLSLMDCGVPIKAPVAGIAMGLIKQNDKIAVLSDILGDEDHLGDMDFKVAGTKTGITAVQMDIKIDGIDKDVMQKALYQAKEGRLHILSRMDETLTESREELSRKAPRVITMKIHRDKIRDLIGPQGKTIKGIIEKTGASINVADSGVVTIATFDGDSASETIKIVENIIKDPEMPEMNAVYSGLVKKIHPKFGVFVEVLPGCDGLVHISELDNKFITDMDEVIEVGERVNVKVIKIDRGKIRLSRKQAFDVESDDVINALDDEE
jgi:polyribonucleotide nucleotidyltransferase